MDTSTKRLLYRVMIIVVIGAFTVFLSNVTNALVNRHMMEQYEKELEETEQAVSLTEASFLEQETRSLEYLRGTFQNDDIIAKLSIPGVLSTLLVKGDDNQFYRTHLFDRTENKTGSIFLDYRNEMTSSPRLFLYGRDFDHWNLSIHELQNYLDPNFGVNHQELFLETDQEVYRYEIFSVEVSREEPEMSETVFEEALDLSDTIHELERRSRYLFPTKVTKTKQILTMKTVVEGEDTFLLFLHAKRREDT